MTALRRRVREDLQRRGWAPKTQPCARDAVTPLAPHDRRAPAPSRAGEMRPSVLDVIKARPVAGRTWRLHLDGIRCCYERTLQRPWPVCARIRHRPRPTRPVGLRPQAVRSLRALGPRANARMGLQRIAACGRRWRAGPPRQVAAIAPRRLLVRVRPGPGGNDRWVPRAARPLARWRLYWPRARPRPWGFPARPQQTPRPATTLQTTCPRVVRQRGLATDASGHTRRHASAPPL
jgi:integrase/recombinase XerD